MYADAIGITIQSNRLPLFGIIISFGWDTIFAVAHTLEVIVFEITTNVERGQSNSVRKQNTEFNSLCVDFELVFFIHLPLPPLPSRLPYSAKLFLKIISTKLIGIMYSCKLLINVVVNIDSTHKRSIYHIRTNRKDFNL